MIYLPDTNACITLLRQKNLPLIARWRAIKPSDIVLCAVVVYELRYGAEHAANSAEQHAMLDVFLRPFVSLAFDDRCSVRCAQIRHALERTGTRIGPYDLQIAAIACEHDLSLVTHNTREFSRIASLKLQDWET